jgi:multidrug efflux system outer membrane protein
VTVFALLLSVGCNPRLPHPSVEIPARYIYGDYFSQDTLGIDAEWWRIFGDDTLNALVDRALSNNNNVEIALSRIEQAHLQLKVARSSFLPSFDFGVSVEGNYNNVEKYKLDYKIGPSMSWEFGMGGKLKHTLGVARAALLESEWAYRGTKLSLVAEVATAYFTLLQYERIFEIAHRTYLLRSESVSLIDSMFRYGMSSGLDLEQARSLMFTALSDMAQYERAVKQTHLALDTLIGDVPTEWDDVGLGLNLLTDFMPIDVPIGLPSDLLYRRPDVMEVYYTLVGCGEKVGIARAERFPTFAMTLTGGIASDKFKKLFTGMPFVWGATRAITQPIFSFGQLKRNEEIARQEYLQSVATYRQTMLEALSEVEQALVAITTYNEQTERYADMVLSNSNAARMTRALYESGLSDYFDVIESERTLYTSQQQLIALVAQQYINYVTLFKALGGGW